MEYLIYQLARFFTFLTQGFGGFKKPQNLGVELSAVSNSFESSRPIELIFKVRNNHKRKQKICTYFTPFEGFYGNFLKVLKSNGERVPYRGIMKKRGGPVFFNFISIAPNETKEVAFNVAETYDITEKDTYSVTFIGNESVNKLPDSNTITIEVK